MKFRECSSSRALFFILCLTHKILCDDARKVERNCDASNFSLYTALARNALCAGAHKPASELPSPKDLIFTQSSTAEFRNNGAPCKFNHRRRWQRVCQPRCHVLSHTVYVSGRVSASGDRHVSGKNRRPPATGLRKQTEKRMVENSPNQATALPEVSCGFPV